MSLHHDKPDTQKSRQMRRTMVLWWTLLAALLLAPPTALSAPTPATSSCQATLTKECQSAKGNTSTCLTCILTNAAVLSAAGCTSSDEATFCLPPAPPLSCQATLTKECQSAKGNKATCLTCILTNAAVLSAAGCTSSDEATFCLPPAPSPFPPPAGTTPPPASTCVDWLYCDADDDHPHDCEKAGATVIAGHFGGRAGNGFPEGVCIPIALNGSTLQRAGHANLIPAGKRAMNNWGCDFNGGPSPDGRHCPGWIVDNGCNDRIGTRDQCLIGGDPKCFREFRMVQKAGASPLRWILSSHGFKTPPGAVQIGGGRIVARTLPANTNGGNTIPGFCETAAGRIGELYFDSDAYPGHPSNQGTSSDFEIACCGSDADCKPIPPKKPPVYKHPWVRFAHAIPAAHSVDCVVTLQNETKNW